MIIGSRKLLPILACFLVSTQSAFEASSSHKAMIELENCSSGHVFSNSDSDF